MWIYTVLDLDLLSKSWTLCPSKTTQQQPLWHTNTVRLWRSYIFPLCNFSQWKCQSKILKQVSVCLQCSSSFNKKSPLFRTLHYQNSIKRMRLHTCYRLKSRKGYNKDGDLVTSPCSHPTCIMLWPAVSLGTTHKVPSAQCLCISKLN